MEEDVAMVSGRPRRRTAVRLLWVIAASTAVVVGLWLFGRSRTPSYTAGLFGEHGTAAVGLKARIATVILALALIQLVLALWMYQKLPTRQTAPVAVARTHRVVGVALLLATLPVAIHCMIAYGVQTYTARVSVHSLAGCVFYGAFLAKVLVVRSRHLPGWTLPVVGGLLVTIVAVLWYSSALWFFNGYRLP